MRSIINVAWFTIKNTIKKTSFLVSNIIIRAIIFIMFNMINFLFGHYVLTGNDASSDLSSETTEEVDVFDNTEEGSIPEQSNLNTQEIDTSNSIVVPITIPKYNIGIIDRENILGGFMFSYSNIRVDFLDLNNLSDDEINSKLESGELFSVIKIYKNQDEIKFDYLVYESSKKIEGQADALLEFVKDAYYAKFASDKNLSNKDLDVLQKSIIYEVKPLHSDNKLTIDIVFGILISIVLFMSIYLYGHSISLSISSEKNSRVIETLVTSTSPSHIVIGKTLGMGLLGLAQLIVMILFSVLCYKQYIPAGIDIVNIFLSKVNISTTSIVLMLVYFILGYTLYAFMNAITGAIVSKSEDVQTVNLPLYFISMLCFYSSFFTIGSTDSRLDTFVELFPLASPFAMPSKIIGGLVNNYEIAASLLLLFITTILFAFISIRIYSVAILHYGNKMKIRDIFNIFIRFK